MALSAGTTLSDLLSSIPHPGRLEWIGLRPAGRTPMLVVEHAQAEGGKGLIGDRATGGKRGITLIQHEHLAVLAALCARDHVPPELLRRNLVVSGINLLALRNRRFSVGPVLLEGTGLCHPCSRMEEALGPGGFNAMRGHGGITAQIVTGGRLAIGDTVRLVQED